MGSVKNLYASPKHQQNQMTAQKTTTSPPVINSKVKQTGEEIYSKNISGKK
jgi:hypothetical protein